jgi:GT2 family glycosyltransferase
MNLLVSIVVPTCGRPELLERCLAALERQSLARDRYEVIVIEDRERRGPAWARNRGWRRARAPLVAFTDDDCVPAPDWLRCGLEPFSEGADVVCGRIVMPLPEHPTDYERDAQRLERSEFVTANCLCRRELLERLGGFDERFRLAWREDSDLHFRLLELGARIVFEPRAIVVHPVRPAPWGVSVSQQRKVMFDALLFKKHPRLYRERIRAAPRWDYYLTVAALVLGLVNPWFFALWGLLTLRFFMHRLHGTTRSARHVVEMLITSIAIPPVAVFWRIVGMLKFKVGFA